MSKNLLRAKFPGTKAALRMAIGLNEHQGRERMRHGRRACRLIAAFAEKREPDVASREGVAS